MFNLLIARANAEMQARQGARGFLKGVYTDVHEQKKRSATMYCDLVGRARRVRHIAEKHAVLPDGSVHRRTRARAGSVFADKMACYTRSIY